ncbi:GntR family transcriptional regulator [Crenobacter caeni]|uniref:GntR family transcriptional regulator n=1 Tax=Crenobacter caeni TaxID=2705474 RepID=A0A6B2KPT0_9NEIS|nr:GntR family transcriptional regulator [Crenobacter caeni]NDV12158.1 GntR family transcriptional regulator [Crenobacter caeni]
MTFKANDSLTEQIAAHLGEHIIRGTLAPNARIQELRIAAELSVSRSSVREALLILERRQLIRIYPRRGAVVESMNADDVRAFLELWFLLLEQAMKSVAARWQHDDLAPLFECEAQLAIDRRQDDIAAFYATSFEFLGALYARCGNRYLQATLEEMQPLTRRCLYAIFRAGQPQLARAQAFIADAVSAIVARDGERIGALSRALHDTYSQVIVEATRALSAAEKV